MYGFFFFFGLSIFFHWCICLFIPVPHCFDCRCFVVSFEVRKYAPLYLVFIFQSCFDYLGPLKIPYQFRDWLFHFCKKTIGILIGIGNAMNLQITLGSIAILGILNSLSICEHGMPFHLVRSQFLSAVFCSF